MRGSWSVFFYLLGGGGGGSRGGYSVDIEDRCVDANVAAVATDWSTDEVDG